MRPDGTSTCQNQAGPPSPEISLAFINFFLHNHPKRENAIKKKFDCMEFKRRAQAEIFEETHRMTPQQEIEYFNKKAETGSLGQVVEEDQEGIRRMRRSHDFLSLR